MNDDTEYIDDEELSKTQRKKDAHAQQELGERLTRLPEPRLDELPLTDSLRAAIAEFKRIPTKRGAVKRQRQFIGRLIRDCDTGAIEAALSAQQESTSAAAGESTVNAADQWCQVVVEAGDDGIQQAVAALPAVDRQELRQLYRNYSKASETKKVAAQERISEYFHALLQS